jgi:uncharacterized protein (UPF0264 family)
MQLLVSVADAADARAAVEGGADIVDAKDPSRGPLGAVRLDAFAPVVHAVNGVRPVSAALGEPSSDAEAAALAAAFTGAGATFVKIGFEADMNTAAIGRRLRAVHDSAGEVIAVAYADARSDLFRRRIVDAALSSGITGVLLDTADKDGPGLCQLLSPDELASWTREVASSGLLVALAGKLTVEDVERLQDVGCGIVGVRGAACEGGRAGRVTADRVKKIRRGVRSLNLTPT